MRFQVILNRDGGTLRTLDLDGFSARTCDTLEGLGHEVGIVTVGGGEIESALEDAAAGAFDVVMAGGGDGTVSTAARILMESGKALAVLPAGTMNLFARSLQIPLDLDRAVAAFGEGRMRQVDLASANGRIFIHQFSIGLHAKLIRLREKQEFRSRLGKMLASLRAGFATIFRPPRLKVEMTIDGRTTRIATAGIGVTNNLLGEGHLPYADVPDGGALGVYVTRAWRKRDLARMFLNMALGRWRTNQHVDIRRASEVELKLLSRHERFGCAIDGELCGLETATRLRIHPGALKVLVPAG